MQNYRVLGLHRVRSPPQKIAKAKEKKGDEVWKSPTT